jgi:adenylylsulfate kinase
MGEDKNLFPGFKRLVSRRDKEELLHQKGKVIWLTGLSGSGKTSLGVNLEKHLHRKGYLTQVFDGDNIRSGINSDLDFTDEGRKENIRRVAELSKLFVDCGIIVISCFISPTNKIRKMAKNIIGSEDFIEVFVDVPIEICEQRDVKGLYKKARKGEVKNFTGLDSCYEKPKKPDITIDTSRQDKEISSKILLNEVMKYITK